MVIHAATAQLRPVRAGERQRTCNSKQCTTPAQRPVACPARPLAPLSTSALFLPARRCYTRSSLSPSFQLFRAPSRHIEQVPAASSRPALDRMPRPRERVCERFLLRRAAHPSRLSVVRAGIGTFLFTAGIHLQA